MVTLFSLEKCSERSDRSVHRSGEYSTPGEVWNCLIINAQKIFASSTAGIKVGIRVGVVRESLGRDTDRRGRCVTVQPICMHCDKADDLRRCSIVDSPSYPIALGLLDQARHHEAHKSAWHTTEPQGSIQQKDCSAQTTRE